MSTTVIAISSAAALLGIANFIISYLVVRSSFYTASQKAIQCAIVWFIPIFGVVAVGAFLKAQFNWAKFDTRAFPERSEKDSIAAAQVVHGGPSHD